jgi:hypothetical protein
MANQNDTFAANASLAQDNDSPEQNDDFWTHEEIDGTRWNKSFPYQLLLVKKQGSGYVSDAAWTFTLPISPESISFSMPFAIQGQVQLDGFHESHGGAPVRFITFTGTTGVMPLRGSAESRGTANLGEAIFAGTIQNAARTAQAATGQPPQPNVLTDDELSSILNGSGYYQFRKLQEWFENYVAFKKTEAGREWRMALAIWKDQAIYLVTPQTFNVSRNAGSPYEYPYQLAFKAWKRVKLSAPDPAANVFQPAVRDANKLGKMLKAISDARNVLEAARDTIAAVGGDLDHALFEPVRELALFVKDLVGVPIAMADLPVQILTDAKQAIISAISVQAAQGALSQAFSTANAKVQEQVAQIALLGSQTSQAQVQNGVLAGAPDGSTDPANDPFNDPTANYALFSQVNIGQVNLPPSLVRAVVNERERVRQKTRLDFEQQRDTLIQIMADFADAVGAGSSSFATAYGRRQPNTTRQPTTQDHQVLFAMNRMALELNRLAASGETNRFQIDSINYMAGLASRSGIAFQIPKSKFSVPYPYGVTIEQLATRYLGDPDRWIEIVALNGLRAPYVDEEGFDLPLLTDGRGNEVQVADSSLLFVGQMVWLSSTTTSRTSRRITKIKKLTSTQSILTLDGDPDLERFSTLAQASLHAFLPDTVNSMMTIYIPSDSNPGDQDYKTKAIPGLNTFDPFLTAGGVDLLLTESGDLAITPDGDCRLAVGLANIVQIARTRLSVQQGTLNRHPQFGLAIKAGMSTADVDAKTLLESTKTLFADDPMFTGVKGATVVKKGNATTIALQVGIQGVSQFIPISFNVPR